MKLRLSLATMAALLASFAMAASASAAAPTVTVTSQKASFADDGSNTDQVVVTTGAGAIPGTVKYTFTDHGLSMSSGNPLACMPASGTSISCTVPGGTGVDVNLGDAPSHAPQSVQFSGVWTNQVSTAEGGSGDDTFEGSSGNETFNGGAGADTFDGNGGTDTVAYSGDTEPVYAAIDGKRDSGTGCPSSSACEHDTVGTDITNLTGGSGNDTLIGDANKNTLDGGDGNDMLLGGDGNDTLLGNNGDDDLDGGFGADLLDGGAGSNTADYSNDGRTTGVKVNIATHGGGQTGEGDQYAFSTGPTNTTTPTIQNAIGTAFDDTFNGDTNANDFRGGAGMDTAKYDDGSHDGGVTVSFDDQANDGLANEADNIHSDIEAVYGGAGADTFLAGNASETFVGNGQPDKSNGDTLSFANITDPVTATIGTSPGSGHAGANSYAISGVENLTGGKGNDDLTGSAVAGFPDFVDGGPGDDTVRGGPGVVPNALIGGAGSDTADYSSDGRTVGVSVDLNTGSEQSLAKVPVAEDALSTIENVRGTGNDDVLNGDSNNNRLEGGAGKDTLRGRGGNDLLEPGTGGDGGSDGAGDLVSGGAGIDVALYSDRATPVNVTLDGNANDGADGEKDNVLSDVEGVIGGGAGDTLSADTDANDVVNNIFDGGPGNDTITSLGGNDTITGGSGQDNVDAGAGDDTLNLIDGEVDTAACGDGSDTVNADSIDKVGADCETVNINASSTPPAPSPSVVLINNPSTKEGNRGTHNLVFTVKLNAAQTAPVTVAYASADITAKAGSDYRKVSGLLTFNPGETSKRIVVKVIGDRRYERNETFAVGLGKPTGNATLATKFYGTGTIRNDDRKPKRGKPGPAAFTVRVTPHSDHTAPYSFRVSGRLGVPGGVSARRACTGKVAVIVQVQTKKLHGKVPVSKACAYGFRFHTSTKPAGGTITFRVRFLGNRVLARSAQHTIVVRAG